MEARIEALTAEVSELKKECQVSITTVTTSENTPPFLSHESRSPPNKKKKKKEAFSLPTAQPIQGVLIVHVGSSGE